MFAGKKNFAEAMPKDCRAAFPLTHQPAPRSRGELRLGFKLRQQQSVLDRLYQAGNLRARIVRPEPGHCCEAVLLNTAGGLAGGDRLDATMHWGAGTYAAVTTQACEKVYRAQNGTALVSATLEVEHGATAEWLPQETILFDRAALSRDLKVRMDVGASFTGIEALLLGRAAMGETVSRLCLRDGWRIWRGNRLIYADVTALTGDIPALLARAAITGARTAFATLIHVGARAEAMLDIVRTQLVSADDGTIAAASAWDGLLAVRVLAQSGAALRRLMVRLLDIIRPDYALPRVWQI